MDIEITKENKTQFEKDMCAAAYMGMSYGRYKAYQKTLAELTPETCKGFVNGNCAMNCPNAKLEGACNRWDLEPSDFGMEYIDCEECYMNKENCTCEEDCYVYGNKDYCPKASNNGKEL